MKKVLMFVVIAAIATSSSAATIKGRVTGGAAKGTATQVIVWVDEPAAKPSKPVVISQKGMKFTPTTAAAVTGQTVDFPNDDDTAHQVYSLSATKKFNLGFYAAGEKRSVVVDKPGIVDVRCYIHQNMKATLIVVPGTQYAVTTLDADYTIADVAPGKRVIKMWSASGEQRKEVVVPKTGELTVDFAAAK